MSKKLRGVDGQGFGKALTWDPSQMITCHPKKIPKFLLKGGVVQFCQVYCAWLIQWVVKREIIQLTELCLTRWWIISGTWWYWVSIWRYWLVLGQYKLVLLDIRWYMVSKGLVCLYILEKVEIWSGDTDAWQTDWQTSEDRATQLLSSIKHKLSHAIYLFSKPPYPLQYSRSPNLR